VQTADGREPHTVPEDEVMAAQTRVVRFPGATGHELVGRVEMPPGEVLGRAVLAHCFSCGKDLKAIVRISRALAEQGLIVLRFDFTGLGESAGDFADTNFSSNVDDLEAAAGFLSEEHGPADLMVGHSLGGAAVLAVAGRLPEVKAVAPIAAPSSTDHLRRTLLEGAPERAGSEEAELDLGGRRVKVRRQLLEDLAEGHLESEIGQLGRPLLVFHSPVDEVVGIEHARKIFKAARHPKSFVSLDGADHLLLANEADSRFVGGVLARWAARYLERSEALKKAGGDEVAEGGEVFVAGGPEGYETAIRAGRHRLVADEPIAVGGTDRGPNPYDLLLAALGACKSMTLRMYADRKGWPLEEVRLRLRHHKLHAKDCEECRSEGGRVDRIEVQLEVTGDLDAEQRRRLREISERCPVHQTLISETSIRSASEESSDSSS